MDNEYENERPTANGAEHNGDKINDGATADMPAPPKTLNVAFKHQNGSELVFRMKPTTKLGKAMDGFSARIQRDVNTMRFLLEGGRIQANQTLADLDVDEDCQIDVFEEQVGGGN